MNYFNSCEILLAAGLSRLQGGWDFNIFPPTQILDDFKNLQCYLGSGHIALQFSQPFYTEPKNRPPPPHRILTQENSWLSRFICVTNCMYARGAAPHRSWRCCVTNVNIFCEATCMYNNIYSRVTVTRIWNRWRKYSSGEVVLVHEMFENSMALRESLREFRLRLSGRARSACGAMKECAFWGFPTMHGRTETLAPERFLKIRVSAVASDNYANLEPMAQI